MSNRKKPACTGPDLEKREQEQKRQMKETDLRLMQTNVEMGRVHMSGEMLTRFRFEGYSGMLVYECVLTQYIEIDRSEYYTIQELVDKTKNYLHGHVTPQNWNFYV